MEREGLGSLQDGELLALLLGTGQPGRPAERLADELLHLAGGSLHNLATWPPHCLTQVPGVGPAKAFLAAAAMEVGRRRQHASRPLSERMKGSQDVFGRFQARLSDLQHEEFWIMLLKRSNDVLAEVCIS